MAVTTIFSVTTTLAPPLHSSSLFVPVSRYDSVRIGPAEAIRRIKEVVERIRWEISSPRKDFNCPVTLSPMRHPVVTNCEHTFEKYVVEKLAAPKPCPTCRTAITSFALCRPLQEEIARTQTVDLIPTLCSTATENLSLVAAYLAIARGCTNFADTVGAYRMMLCYTKSAICYLSIPFFYLHLRDFEKAAFAFLHLATYNLQEGNVIDAVLALDYARKASPTLRIGEVFTGLMLSMSLSEEQIRTHMGMAAGLAAKESPEDKAEAVAIYKQVLSYGHALDAYKALAVLTEDPEEKKGLLLEAAEFAELQGKFVEGRDLRAQAASIGRMASLSHEFWRDPAAFRDRLPPYPPALAAFLLSAGSDNFIVFPVFPTILKDGVSVPLTLNSLDRLDRDSGGKGYRIHWQDHVNRGAVEGFYWGVMTKGIVEGTRNKTYEQQMALLTHLGYEMPTAVEAAAAALWHRRRTGERCLGDAPWTYTICQPKVDDCALAVGGCTERGLHILNTYITAWEFGAAGFKKFRA